MEIKNLNSATRWSCDSLGKLPFCPQNVTLDPKIYFCLRKYIHARLYQVLSRLQEHTSNLCGAEQRDLTVLHGQQNTEDRFNVNMACMDPSGMRGSAMFSNDIAGKRVCVSTISSEFLLASSTDCLLSLNINTEIYSSVSSVNVCGWETCAVTLTFWCRNYFF